MEDNTSSIGAGSTRGTDLRSLVVACTAYAILATAVLALVPDLPAVIAIPLALPLIVLVPGFVLLTAVFPATTTDTSGDGSGTTRTAEAAVGLDLVERVGVAFPLSIAIVPLVALAVTWLVGIRIVPILLGVTATTVVAGIVGYSRVTTQRLQSLAVTGGSVERPSDAQSWQLPLWNGLTVVTVIVVIALLGASAALAFGATGSETDLRTEFYAVNDDGVARTPQVTATGTASLTLAVEHHAATAQQYSVVIQAVESDGTTTETERFARSVGPAETATESVSFDTAALPDSARLQILLFTGDPPAEPTLDGAHRVLGITQLSPAEEE